MDGALVRPHRRKALALPPVPRSRVAAGLVRRLGLAMEAVVGLRGRRIVPESVVQRWLAVSAGLDPLLACRHPRLGGRAPTFNFEVPVQGLLPRRHGDWLCVHPGRGDDLMSLNVAIAGFGHARVVGIASTGVRLCVRRAGCRHARHREGIVVLRCGFERWVRDGRPAGRSAGYSRSTAGAANFVVIGRLERRQP